jgi:Zn-finger nucleic acid-binding protein
MLCPRCQIVLNSIILKDIQIDICPVCHGVWLDKGELQKLIETHAPIDIDAGQADRKIDEKLWEGEIACPICGKLMQKFRYAVTSDIVIDSCREGCGVWLDKGEIIRIADYLATAEEPLSNIQKEQVKERLRTFKEANKNRDSFMQFLNLKSYSQTELEKDLNTTPAGQYVLIIRMVVQGLLYFLLRKL